MQVIAQLTDEGVLAAGTRQEVLVGGLGIEGAKEAQAVYEIADESIDRDHAFFLELAQGNLNGPCTRSWRAEAIEGQIGTLADAHACMAQ